MSGGNSFGSTAASGLVPRGAVCPLDAISERAIVSVCSMCRKPMSTAFRMSCVCPSTRRPAAFDSSITARSWSSVSVRSTFTWSTPAALSVRT